MKKYSFLYSTLLLLFFLASCCKDKSNNNNNNNNNNTTTVPIAYTDTTSLPIAIPPFPTSTLVNVKIDTFATKVDEFISPYGVTKEKITKVNLKNLSMKLENTAQTFNFIKNLGPNVSAEIFVDSFGGANPVRVAYINDIAPNITSMDMLVETVDIKDFFRAQYMEIWVKFYTAENEGLLANTKFRFNFTFEVTLIP
ncbi:MAG: hypothetical protein R2831_06445 [Chitinophagaceae bacterium]